jgi:hypothetical protein
MHPLGPRRQRTSRHLRLQSSFRKSFPEAAAQPRSAEVAACHRCRLGYRDRAGAEQLAADAGAVLRIT